MNKTIIIFFFYILFSFNLVFGKTNNDLKRIDYTITISDKKHLVVNAKFHGNFRQNFVFNLPYQFGPSLYNSTIQNLRAITKIRNITHNEEGANQITLDLPRDTKIVELEYEVHPKKDKKYFEIHDLVLNKDLIHFIGHAIFVTPKNIIDKDKINVNIKWINLPRNWKSLSSYGEGDLLDFTSTIPGILRAVYVSGNVRGYKKLVNNKPVTFSLYGNFNFDDKKIVDNFLKIVEAQRDFFKDYDFANYLVSIVENPDGNDKMALAGGTALDNSTVMHISKSTPFKQYKLIFAHEHFHNWIGGKIKNSEEILNYWWSEGFTDYYSRVISLRYSLLTPDEFISELGTIIKDYYNSPVISLTNEDIKKGFWSSYEVQRLPYLRGFIFALYLNCEAKSYIKSNLTDLILMDLHENNSQKFSNKRFADLLDKYSPSNFNAKKYFSDYIEKGHIIPLDKCAHLLPVRKAELYDLNKKQRYFYYLPKKLNKAEKEQIIKFFAPELCPRNPSN